MFLVKYHTGWLKIYSVMDLIECDKSDKQGQATLLHRFESKTIIRYPNTLNLKMVCNVCFLWFLSIINIVLYLCVFNLPNIHNGSGSTYFQLSYTYDTNMLPIWYFWSEWSACAALGCWQNEDGHYFWYIILLLFLVPLFKTPEGVVVGIQIFAWAPN